MRFARARRPGGLASTDPPVPTSPPRPQPVISPPQQRTRTPSPTPCSFLKCINARCHSQRRRPLPAERVRSGAESDVQSLPARRLSHAGDPARQAAPIADPLAAALVLRELAHALALAVCVDARHHRDARRERRGRRRRRRVGGARRANRRQRRRARRGLARRTAGRRRAQRRRWSLRRRWRRRGRRVVVLADAEVARWAVVQQHLDSRWQARQPRACAEGRHADGAVDRLGLDAHVGVVRARALTEVGAGAHKRGAVGRRRRRGRHRRRRGRRRRR